LQLQYRKNGGYITAPQGKSYFRDCRVSNVPENATSMNNNFALARPWRTSGKAFFINTTFDIVPSLGFTTMSGNVFPVGSCGSVGNIKKADGTLPGFVNDASTPIYTMTEEDILNYSSVYGTCGSGLAALVSESVTIPDYGYATLYAADALTVPTGVTAYAVASINNDYIETEELYTPGEVIPACTPVILKADVTEATDFRFAYVDNVSTVMSGTNLLSGCLVHKALPAGSYTLGTENNVAAFLQQGSDFQMNANTAYLTPDNGAASVLPFKSISTGMNNSSINDTGNDDCFYDLQGRRVFQPQKGNVYITKGYKQIYLK
jgi:hypothetical protein